MFFETESHWGKEYCSEILKGLLQYCLNDFGLDKISANVERDNMPSVRIHKNHLCSLVNNMRKRIQIVP